jgi:hypothetical protein
MTPEYSAMITETYGGGRRKDRGVDLLTFMISGWAEGTQTRPW